MKLQRPSVCNAIESLVIHKDISKDFIPVLIDYIPSVTVHGDQTSVKIDSRTIPATPLDFYTENLDKVVSMKL